MAGYYVISSPSQRVVQQESEYAVKKADLRSIAECVVAAQNAAMYGDIFDDKQGNDKEKILNWMHLVLEKCSFL